jgi:Radial spokehead-like protein
LSPCFFCSLIFFLCNVYQVIEVEDPVEIAVPLASIKPEEWTFRLTPGGAGAGKGSAVVARSLIWPGAVAVVAGKRFVNIYTGHGIVYSKTKFSPPCPPAIQNEWQAPTESERERARERGEEGEGGITLVEEADVREDPIIPMLNSDIEDEDE